MSLIKALTFLNFKIICFMISTCAMGSQNRIFQLRDYFPNLINGQFK